MKAYFKSLVGTRGLGPNGSTQYLDKSSWIKAQFTAGKSFSSGWECKENSQNRQIGYTW